MYICDNRFIFTIRVSKGTGLFRVRLKVSYINILVLWFHFSNGAEMKQKEYMVRFHINGPSHVKLSHRVFAASNLPFTRLTSK